MHGDELRTVIVEHGTLGRQENERIYHKFFKRIPWTFRYCLERYHLDKRRTLEIGCTYGNTLIHLGPGSVGVDVFPAFLTFARALGLTAIEWNVDEDIPKALEQSSFDAIWCSNVIEHVIAPHLLLRKCHHLLRDDGLLFLGFPVIPLPIIRRHKLFRGYLAQEHINFFSATAMALTLERAGFAVLEMNSCVPPQPRIVNAVLRPVLNYFAPSLTAVAQKRTEFAYAAKRDPIFTPTYMREFDNRYGGE